MSKEVQPPSFAIVTGGCRASASNLAHCCAQAGYDILIAADEPLDSAC